VFDTAGPIARVPPAIHFSQFGSKATTSSHASRQPAGANHSTRLKILKRKQKKTFPLPLLALFCNNMMSSYSGNSSQQHKKKQQQHVIDASSASVDGGGNGGGVTVDHHPQQSRHHKRERAAATSSNNSGSTRIETTTSTATAATANKRPKEDNAEEPPLQSEQQQQHEQQQQQPIENEQNNAQQSNINNNSNNCDHNTGWRVKLYRLNSEGSWDDCGTGRIYKIEHNSITVVSEAATTTTTNGGTGTTNNHAGGSGHHNNPNHNNHMHEAADVAAMIEPPQVLLRTRILVADAYQRQGDNIITWCEPAPGGGGSGGNSSNSNNDDHDSNDSAAANGGDHQQEQQQQQQDGSNNGVDLALSFQDNEGCLCIWKQLTATASHNMLSNHHHGTMNNNNLTVEDLANAQATDMLLQRLPRPVTLDNLQGTADKISVFSIRQRDGLAIYVGENNCGYLRELLSLFTPAEHDHLFAKLATLAACVKSILLMNDPCILDATAQDAGLFYDVCACLEYDPDLREKSNHRWFLQQRARFRTVVPMHDPDLIDAIHRSFRVQYLKDTLLRPTMDESSLSSLQSLQTFCHAEVIKGVTAGPTSLEDSYLVNVMHLLSVEVYALQWLEWQSSAAGIITTATATVREDTSSPEPTIVAEHHHNFPADAAAAAGSSSDGGGNGAQQQQQQLQAGAVTWKQHVMAQDESVPARKERRKGCLLFLKELFNMVRVSLQPCEKDDFVAVVGTLLLELSSSGAGGAEETAVSMTTDDVKPMANNGLDEASAVLSSSKALAAAGLDNSKIPFPPTTNLLSILATLLLERLGDIDRHCCARPGRVAATLSRSDDDGKTNDDGQAGRLVPGPVRQCRRGAAHFKLDPDGCRRFVTN
jgi:Component of IIS longevity pathway SMK-1